jgi:transcriptional regulator with XRE-family HTH domain
VWVQDQKAVGVILAAARKRADLSQAELARKLAKPQSFVSNYEKGQRRIDLLELIRIAKALNLDPKRVLAELLRQLERPSRTRSK